MAKSKKVVLDLEKNSISDALKEMKEGNITEAQFEEFCRAKEEQAAKKASSGGGKKKAGKDGCEITRTDFLKHAKSIKIIVDGGEPIEVEVKQFSTGSFGWYFSGKVKVKVGNKEVRTQANLSFPIVNSKEAKD